MLIIDLEDLAKSTDVDTWDVLWMVDGGWWILGMGGKEKGKRKRIR